MLHMLDDFIRGKRLQGLSEKSLKSYRDILRPFCRFCACPPQELTIEQVEAYLETTLSKKVSRATYATYCRNIRIFLKFGREQGLTGVDPDRILVPKSPRRAVRLLSPGDIRKVLDAGSAADPALILRNAAILALMFDSGLRQAEVCRLRTADIHFPEHYAIVRGKGDKKRYVPLGETVTGYLSAYLPVRPFFFLDCHGGPLSENAVKQFVYKLRQKTGIPFSSHKLRHNFATNYCIDHYEKNGQVDIYKLMHLLGHSNIRTTEIYLHFALDIVSASNHLSHLDKLSTD